MSAFRLTSTSLLIVVAVLALALPVVLVLTWRRRPHGIGGGALRLVVVLVCQVLAVAGVGLAANNSFGFYNSWSDLLGTKTTTAAAVTSNGLVPADGSLGRIVSMSVPMSVPRLTPVAHGSSRSLTVLAWLPPQYDQTGYRQTRFPVTMMLPGQPGTPQGVFSQFRFATAATTAIADHLVTPFVAIFPPLMVAPPRDTECTDVPDGPQAETWLSHDVRDHVVSSLRVTTDPRLWSTMGWSTGGFCAAKLLLRHPTLFNAAVGFGGYYDSETDKTTGRLFGNSQALRNENSPLWLIQHRPRATNNLLIIVSKADRSSYDGRFYADSKTMIAATSGMSGVSTILLESGGHNFRVYQPTLGQALTWLGRTAGL